MSSLIEMQGVKKVYQAGDNEITALAGIDLQLNKGEFAAIVGESGAGKSTLVDIVGLLNKPSSGRYLFDGHDISACDDAELSHIRGHKIGFVFQSYFLLPRLNAMQNVAMPLFYQKVSYKESHRRAKVMLEKLGVGHLWHHKPSEMSGGQQQRVAIARALVGNPELILADEPTGALDSKTSDDIMNLFLQLHEEEHKSILMITHDVALSKRVARRIKIVDGKLYDD